MKYLLIVLIIIIIITIYYDINKSKPNISNLNKIIKKYPDYIFVISILSYSNHYSKKNINNLFNYIYLIKNYYKIKDISIKITWFVKNGILDYNKLESIVDYASKYNKTIIIASLFKKHQNIEVDAYLRLLKKNKNIIITLATYHSTTSHIVNKVLNKKGSIRLVKGWWADGDIKNWDKVTKNYELNAIKLINDPNKERKHILATHDFNLLGDLYKQYENRMAIIEISFFYFNQYYVERMIKNFRYDIKIKSFYISYGLKTLGIPFFIVKSNQPKNIKMMLKSIKNKVY